MNPKFFIGPMTKNVVDSIITFCNETNNIIGLIPSRRQVEYNGGYVNNWTTRKFANYVKARTHQVILQRDHSGPGQGNIDDDGYESLKTDAYYLNLIHIDPWKKYSEYTDGLKWTVDMIKYCNNINPDLEYEVGTEQSIRKFESEELDRFLFDLKYELQSDGLFNKIKYLVTQSGTSLSGNTQTGNYDRERLIEMVKIAKKHNLLSKEHNGDYIPISVIKEKFELGLDSINIAPEFGLIETQTYLDLLNKEENNYLLERFWEICYNSKRWVKWVDPDFDPIKNKIELIKICGHYVISTEEFLVIKNKFPNIDIEVQKNILDKLYKLYE
jgi:fructose/tagatose bisphosphate aldolase